MEKFGRNEKETKKVVEEKVNEGVHENKETSEKNYREMLESKTKKEYLIKLKEAAQIFIKEGKVKGSEEEIIEKILKISSRDDRDNSGFMTTLTREDMTQETIDEGIELFNKFAPTNPLFRANENSFNGSSIYLNCYWDSSKNYYYEDIEVHEKGDKDDKDDKDDYRNYGVSTILGQSCVSCKDGEYWEEN